MGIHLQTNRFLFNARFYLNLIWVGFLEVRFWGGRGG